MKNFTILFTVFIGLILIINSCRHDETDISKFDEICFNPDVKLIFASNCAITDCHNATSAEEGYVLDNYDGIMKGISAGDPLNSEIYKVITNEWINMMPPDTPLTEEQRIKIRLWIEQGAPNNTCSNDTIIPPPVDSVCFNTHIEPILLSTCGVTDCHDATTAQEDIVLTSYASLMAVRQGIVPFSSSQSKIYEVITETSSDDRMPPSPRSPLTASQIEDFNKWISQGAVNSQCSAAACDTSNVTYAESVEPIISTNCRSCHNTNNANAGIILETEADVTAIAQSGLLTGVLRNTSGIKMPPTFDLTECQIRTVEIWTNGISKSY